MVQNVSFKYTKDGVSIECVHGSCENHVHLCLVWRCEAFGIRLLGSVDTESGGDRAVVTWRFWVIVERHIVYNDLCGLQPWIYNNLEFGIDLDTRVALVGPNGAGKSTLLKLLTGEVCLQHGLPCFGPLFFG